MALTRIDIINKNFPRGVRGYSVREVEEFLQEVADEVGRLSEEKKALQGRIEDLETAIIEYKERERSLRDTLAATQKMTDQLKATAQREAQLIIDAANAKGESLVSAAYQRVAKVQEEISALRRMRMQFELKIKSVAESYLKLVEMSRKENEELEAAESKVKYIRKAEGA